MPPGSCSVALPKPSPNVVRPMGHCCRSLPLLTTTTHPQLWQMLFFPFAQPVTQKRGVSIHLQKTVLLPGQRCPRDTITMTSMHDCAVRCATNQTMKMASHMRRTTFTSGKPTSWMIALRREGLAVWSTTAELVHSAHCAPRIVSIFWKIFVFATEFLLHIPPPPVHPEAPSPPCRGKYHRQVTARAQFQHVELVDEKLVQMMVGSTKHDDWNGYTPTCRRCKETHTPTPKNGKHFSFWPWTLCFEWLVVFAVGSGAVVSDDGRCVGTPPKTSFC